MDEPWRIPIISAQGIVAAPNSTLRSFDQVVFREDCLHQGQCAIQGVLERISKNQPHVVKTQFVRNE